MPDVVIIGAGLGGLAAAVTLAARGVDVEVVEGAPGPGGKAAEVVVDGVGFDTGPSVLTLPGILRGILEQAEVSLEDVLTLTRPDPFFRYRWPDGTVLDVYQDPADTERSVREALGAAAASEFTSFMDYSRRIWEAAAPHFVLADAPSLMGVAGLGMAGMTAVSRIDAFRTMQAGIDSQVRTPYLRDLFARFATYNGSDVRKAPGTLNCIAHVEMGIGAFGVRGGIHQLPRALVRVAESLGARLRFGAAVEKVELRAGRIDGVRLVGGERLAARRVVANADVAHLVTDLLPPRPRHGLKTDGPRSTSGWTAVIKRRRTDRERLPHTALFPSRYIEEFRDLFDRSRPPVEPTVYLCDQGVAHDRPGWEDGDPLFVMANAPAEPAAGASDPATWSALREVVLSRLRDAALIGPHDPVVWERSPTGLAERFARSRGSLYGAASNSMFSAFQRPPNRLRRPAGLYLASGSAHPGGGMPLCLQSGRLAAEAVLDDLEVRR